VFSEESVSIFVKKKKRSGDDAKGFFRIVFSGSYERDEEL